MYVAMVSAECAPVAKAGGLGDFVHGLSRELRRRGHEVDVFLPDYDCLRAERLTAQSAGSVPLVWGGTQVQCRTRVGEVDGLRCHLIGGDAPQGFFRRGRIYGEPDDDQRFAFFCLATLELMRASGRRPDVIHCHDWQTGLLPVLLFEQFEARGLAGTRVCYTLHNLGYQGVTAPALLTRVGLDPARLAVPERLLDPGDAGRINLMKGGILFANFVNTVSPRYAWEVQHTEQGMGLQSILLEQDHKFGGVLNGLDYEVWDPAVDPLVPVPFGPDSLPLKADNRAALRERLGLADAAKPIVAVVSRLDHQKGVHLIRHGLRFARANGCQFALLGAAIDPRIDAELQALKAALEGDADLHLELAYDEALAHLIYAGADMILVPSLYEPCGLTQMIAMKYGVVPIVRRVGGLADTVFDANYSDKPFEVRNGYVFDEPTEAALEGAMTRAIGLWQHYPEYFRQLRVNGMRAEHSWAQPAQRYLEIFEHIRVPG